MCISTRGFFYPPTCEVYPSFRKVGQFLLRFHIPTPLLAAVSSYLGEEVESDD